MSSTTVFVVDAPSVVSFSVVSSSVVNTCLPSDQHRNYQALICNFNDIVLPQICVNLSDLYSLDTQVCSLYNIRHFCCMRLAGQCRRERSSFCSRVKRRVISQWPLTLHRSLNALSQRKEDCPSVGITLWCEVSFESDVCDIVTPWFRFSIPKSTFCWWLLVSELLILESYDSILRSSTT